MSAKRALVVDDSKSARSFLSKLLEGHQLDVDSVETAEQAIDYLTRHRPDVIFMDHLMPGMDGFQAVQAIKNNPNTATIPILMYTSQQGELYLGQARALGAMGVLPKQVGPADVGKVLQQLHLTEEHRAASAVQPAAEPDALVEPTAEIPQIPHEAAPVVVPGVDAETLREELAGLRRQVAVYIEMQRERLVAELPHRLRDVLPQPPAPLPPPRNPLPWALAILAGLGVLVLGVMFWGERQLTKELEAQLAARPPLAEGAPANLLRPAAAAAPASATAEPIAQLTVMAVPFGEAPLAGARVERLRELIARLSASAGAGTLEIRRFAGRFCLAGDRSTGFSLAPGDIPYARCELVVDADNTAVTSSPAESLAFANLLAEARRLHPQIRVEVLVGGGDVPQDYPDTAATPQPTAEEWNAAAVANNRVEVRWLPDT